MNERQQFLDQYKVERLPELRPELFGGIPDIPDFVVDQQYVPLTDPVYPV